MILEKLELENVILNSSKAKNLTKITCYKNTWVLITNTTFGLKISYLIDNYTKKIKTCDEIYNDNDIIKICGNDYEYNNKYHVCNNILSELLFYKNIL